MMSDVFWRLRLVAFGLGVLALGSVVEASVLSLRAVKKNDVAITPTSHLAVVGGDKIECDITLNQWANDFPTPQPGQPPGVRSYNVTIDSAGFISPDNGHLTPLGWCAPLTFIPCSPTCPAAYPTCDPNPLIGCRCTTGYDPDLGGFISIWRADFIFPGMDPIRGVDNISPRYVYFAVVLDTAVAYSGVPKYLGTLIVTVSSNACGIFTVNFVNDIGSTFIADAAVPANKSLPTLQPLTLAVSNCARQPMYCDPPHCNIDARIAMDPKTGALQNRNIIDMTFSKPTTGMTTEDLQVTLEPVVDGDVIPKIISVTTDAVNPNKARLIFAPRLRQGRWTCFRDKGSNKRCCMGSLPGDVDENRISNANDVFESYDNLSGVINPVLPLDKSDTDRSLLSSPADLLMIVDLLNGADLFLPTMNQTLPSLFPSCPDMRLPP